ncbi:MAG TPA: transporter substrate-binding domain-containing protein [Vicinamibacteria bacterium]|nr:transporter substrate-binding domain-containing protein [Vicinamibacteria bacterium]
MKLRLPRAAPALALPLLLGHASAAGADHAEIKARGVLRVLVSADENPAWFALRPEGPPGFEREVFEGFARLHKLKLEAVAVERWDQAIPDLVQGKGDVIAGINDTEERRQLIDFTAALVPSQHLVVTRKPAQPIRSLEELRARRIAVVPGTTWAQAVAAASVPKEQVTGFADVDDCLEALRSGRVGAAVMDVADFLLQRRADPALQDGVALGSSLRSAWGVRKTDPELRRQLDAYLVNLKLTPTWSRIVVQYFGNDALRILGRARD